MHDKYTKPPTHSATCTIMYITPYVYSAICTTCTQNHLYIVLNIQHVHSVIYTQHCISNMHTKPYPHNTTYTSCTQCRRCNMYRIYNICTTVVPNIQNHTISTKQSCLQCLNHACPNMSQTMLLSFC